jgi:hypothetical protein
MANPHAGSVADKPMNAKSNDHVSDIAQLVVDSYYYRAYLIAIGHRGDIFNHQGKELKRRILRIYDNRRNVLAG